MITRPVARRVGRLRAPNITPLRLWTRATGLRQYATEERIPIDKHTTQDTDPYRKRSQEESHNLADPSIEESYITIDHNGERYSIDPLYLRDACRCSKCVDEHSGQKRFDTVNIPHNIRADTIKMSDSSSGANYVKITWANDIPGWKHHTSSFPIVFIKSRHIESQAENFSTLLKWNRKSTGLLEPVDYQGYLEDDAILATTLLRLANSGLALISNIPESETSVEKIVERIGNLRDTFYGRTWDVRDKPKAENVAYTSQHLGLHMDLLYMKQPPGFQFLHCLKSSCEGGESIFSDAFRAASILWKQNREDFSTLAEFKTGYHYNRNGKYYKDSKPTFELRMNDRGNLVSDKDGTPHLQHVNWSPPFQSSFPPMKSFELTAMDFRKYHRAARKFSNIINHPDSLLEYRLNPGECVIFNNRRTLHGRKAFESGKGERWFKGAYLNADEFRSALELAFKANPARGGFQKRPDLAPSTEEAAVGSSQPEM